MARVYTELFGQGHGLSGADGFACAPGYIYVVRWVTAFWPGPDPGSIQLVDQSSNGTFLQVSQPDTIGGEWAQWEQRRVLPEGALVAVVGGGALDWSVSGYRLSLP